MDDNVDIEGRQHLRRRSLLAAAGALGLTGGTVALTRSQPARAAAGITKKITIYAEVLPGGLVGYGLTRGGATVPGPVLEMYEGDTLEITLVNTTTQRLSIHPHGVDYSTDSDGSPLHNSFNNPGETRTYVWRSHEMTAAAGRRFMPGSAGYWHYHDHAMGTDHGTGGVAKGLYGALIVRRRGDILPDKQFTVVFHDMTINNKMAPNTPMFEANLGERVEWLAIGHGNLFHTFHLHAHRWVGPDSTAIALAVGDRIADILDQAHRRQFEPVTAPGLEDRSLKAVRETGISNEAVEMLADLQRRFPLP